LKVLGRGEHRLREFPSRGSVSGVLRRTTWSWVSELKRSVRSESYEVDTRDESVILRRKTRDVADHVDR
jgi:hypothetical protein